MKENRSFLDSLYLHSKSATVLPSHFIQLRLKMSVQDKVAIVTGGGLGLGRLYALALAAKGCKVLVNDYGGTLEGSAGTITRAQLVVDEIEAAGGTAVAHNGDVSRDAKDIVATAVKEFGTVHILINNAGITGKMSSHDNVDGPAFMRVLEISVLGTTMVTSAAYSVMAAQKYGRIVNVSSNAIYGFGAGGDCAYGASKGATFAITRELGRWSERDGIKINCIMPSAASRMGDLSEGTKKVTRTYFPPEVRTTC
jgi:NAD(P)-dependent dehydrogenase (short-subunit alcohol dehydrogenase family)